MDPAAQAARVPLFAKNFEIACEICLIGKNI
jgi:hypothetical protein